MEYTKLVQTGNIIEVFRYQRSPAICLPEVASRAANKRRGKRGLSKRRSDSINRAAVSFRRIVCGNLSKGAPDLLTLSMLDIVDIRDAYKCYTKFGSRIRKSFGEAVAWIAVPEFQARGAVHFHILIWNLPRYVVESERDTRFIQNLWGWGYVDLISTDGSERLAYYLSKYLSKGMSDDRLIGVKAYSATRNIMRPMSINFPSAIGYIQEHFSLGVDNLTVFESSYDTLWLGRCIYQRYKIN